MLHKIHLVDNALLLAMIYRSKYFFLLVAFVTNYGIIMSNKEVFHYITKPHQRAG
ncbi:TPA: hypothetical protein IWN12_002427 [Enterococcus faecium]|nr:hypothetical protein [Enterococcus faecium]HAQ0077494.1 hypothetical protein [Enterococcus faecium]